MSDYKFDEPKMRPKYTGALRVRAKAHGMSKKAFAEANIHTNSTVGKLARIAHVHEGLHGDGHATEAEAGDKRSLGQRLYQVG